MRKYLALLFFVFFAIGCGPTGHNAEDCIIPRPNGITIGEGKTRVSTFSCPPTDTMLKLWGKRFHNILNLPADGAGVAVELVVDTTLGNPERYIITVTENKAEIRGGGHPGVFYGLVTLSQMHEENFVPRMTIDDSPTYAWRGFMLDVARHFQPVENVKTVLEMMAFHKLNKFHWHLTDGIGWRIQVDSFPELTRRGAWRTEPFPEAPWVSWSLATKDSTGATGGFYTKDDIREVVQYAAHLGIEVIPEIEMPGHSEAATLCYPQFACSTAAPGSGIYCPGKETTFKYLETVLGEVIGLFPSKYVHIGGDEVGREQWSNCPDCQRRMREEGLKDEAELQNYFTRRIAKFLADKGKSMVGWDEVIDGGVPENVTVMSWTGWEGGIKAAKEGAEVIMCPLDYVYIDHYQSAAPDEPQGWGGANTLHRVYDFPVVPDHLEAPYRKNIIGGQGNLWTENIISFDHLQYMMLPRMAALSEALWTLPENKNWNSFVKRIDLAQNRIYDKLGWKYSTSRYTPMVSGRKVLADGSVEFSIEREVGLHGPNKVYYTLDGSAPTLESEVCDSLIVIKRSVTLRAATLDGETGQLLGYELVVPGVKNLAEGKSVIYGQGDWTEPYGGGGKTALTDGLLAGKRGDDKRWQGFENKDIEVVIVLGTSVKVNSVTVRLFQHKGSTSVILPQYVTVILTDRPNGTGKEFSALVPTRQSFDALIETVNLPTAATEAKYLIVRIPKAGIIPAPHPRAGAGGWVFLDEIIVN